MDNATLCAVDASRLSPSEGDAGLRPTVSVVMVVYMTGPALRESLERALGEARIDELVVVDNGSPPQEETYLRELAQREARVRLVSGQGNVGFARGANLGGRCARGDVLVFLNPDAFLRPNCIDALVLALQARPVPCVVGGRVLNPDLTEQRGARRGDITPVSAVLSLTRAARRLPGLGRYEVHWEREAPPQDVIEVPTVSGACLAMRRCDFDALGGFDEGYFLHVEDVDICWRARMLGGQVLFQPAAQVIHIGHTSQTSPVKVEFHKGVGLARYFRKRARNPLESLLVGALSPFIIAAAVVRPLLWRFRGRAA